MQVFRPFPLLGNAHVQTVLGNLLPGPTRALPAAPITFPLPDGDRLVAQESIPPCWRCGDPVALLVHGLGGCHRSGYMRRVALRLVQQGARAYRLDLRGCGAGIRLARRFYNAGCSGDVRAALECLQVRHPASPLLLAGFSLGGNIVLKLAGESAERPLRSLRAVAAVGPPLDLVRCSALIERQPFYDSYYARKLLRDVTAHATHFPDLPPLSFPRRLTVRQFDDLYTAPRWGYADALDYYRRASSLPWVERSPVPTFLLTARDDPFIAIEPFETLAPAPHIEVHISPYGGHLGFLGPDGRGGIRWAEQRVVDWLLVNARKSAIGTPAEQAPAALAMDY